MVDLAEDSDYVRRNNKKGQRRAVRLDNRHELTPTSDNWGSRRVVSSLRHFLYPLLMIIYG